MKKIILMVVFLSGVIVLSGCEEKGVQNNSKDSNLPTVENKNLKSEVKNEDLGTVSDSEVDAACGKYDDFMGSYCYTEAAVDKNSVDICKKIKGDSEEIEFSKKGCEDEVNEKIALENKDFQYCMKISDNTDCIREIASVTGDPSFCSQVKYKQYDSICQKEADAGRKINEAVDKGDKTICAGIEFYQDRGECFKKLGISLNDSSFCELAKEKEDASEFERAICYSELAKLNADPIYCNKIMDFGNWGELCLENVDTIKKYLAQCLQKEGTDEASCLPVIVKVFNETYDIDAGDTDYSPIAFKNFYNKIKNKCSEWGGSSIAIKNECERITDEIYQEEIE